MNGAGATEPAPPGQLFSRPTGHQPLPTLGGQGRGCQGRAGPADWEGAWQVLWS